MAEDIGSMDPSEIAEAFSAVKHQVVDAVQEARERLEIDRRMRENPWVVLGGGLWPALRPVVKAAARAAVAPSNLLAIAAALGAMRAVRGDAEEQPSAGEAPTTVEPTSH